MIFLKLYNYIPPRIVLGWSLENRADGLFHLTLNEDTGKINALFRKNDINIFRSSDGSANYSLADSSGYVRHRPQEEGPAVITTDGDCEYWENGIHIRTEHAGQNIKG